MVVQGESEYRSQLAENVMKAEVLELKRRMKIVESLMGSTRYFQPQGTGSTHMGMPSGVYDVNLDGKVDTVGLIDATGGEVLDFAVLDTSLSADRTLTFDVNDGDRTLTIEASTIIDQDYSTDSATVTFADLTLTDLTASRLVATSAAKLLESTDIVAWIAGTVNQITVTDDLDGSVTLSLPQDIDTDADVEFDSVVLDDLTASRLVASDAGKKIVSVADLTAWVAGTANQIVVGDDLDGTITLSLPQDIDIGAAVTFASLALTGILTVDTINEYTLNAGVTIEGVLLKDNLIVMGGDAKIYRGAANKIYLGTGDQFGVVSPDGTKVFEMRAFDTYLDFRSRGINQDFYFRGIGDVVRMRLSTGGRLYLPTIGAGAGIVIGGDAGIYRLQANYLCVTTGDYLAFRDNGIYITSLDDGHLDIEADISIDMNAPVYIDGATASRLMATGAGKLLASVGDLTVWIAGTANQIVVTDDLDGTITLSLPQDIDVGATVTFVNLNLTGDIRVQTGLTPDSINTEYPTANDITIMAQTRYLFLGGQDEVNLLSNAYYDGADWQRLDIGDPSWRWHLDSTNDHVYLERVAAGVNPIAGFTQLLEITANADVSIGRLLGAVGFAKLELYGLQANADGPHIQTVSSEDNYPLLQILSWQHDDVAIIFDAYWDLADRSSDVGSNYRIHKLLDKFQIWYDSGIAQGAVITWNVGFSMDTSGLISIPEDLAVGTSFTPDRINTAYPTAEDITIIGQNRYGFFGAQDGTFLVANVYYDGAAWQRIDVGDHSWNLMLDAMGGVMKLLYAAAAANPIAGWSEHLVVESDGGIKMANLASGINQGAAGAVAGELWIDTDDDDTVKMGT